MLLDEVIDERRDVVAPFAQRRDLDRDHVEPVVEVLLEPAVADHLFQIAVGRGDDPHVHALRALGAERLELALLQHAQQLRLHRGAHGPDLVEEDRAAVGQRELAALGHRRAGEGAAHVAEELRFEERVRDGRAVHLDERHLALRAAVMNEPRHHLLAGAGLAGDEHRALGRGDELRPVDHVLHRAAAADDAVVIELGVALAEQVLLFRLQPLAPDRAPRERQQFVDLERLLEKVLDAQLERFAHDLRRAVRRHHDDLRPLRFRHRRGHLADQLEAGHAGHQVVDDEQVERRARRAGAAPRARSTPRRPRAPRHAARDPAA